MNTGENLSINKNNVNLIVERRNFYSGGDTVIYNITGLRPQHYTLEFEAKDIPIQNATGYVEDHFLHTSTLLDLNGKTPVAFTVNAEPASFAADRFGIVFKQNVVLPIKINILTAVRSNEQTVTISWKAENRNDIRSFNVERSADAIHFENIEGLSVIHANQYTQIDDKALKGVVYYRIRSISNDGKEIFSDVVKVDAATRNNGFSVYPNPVTEKNLQLKCSNISAGDYDVRLVNSNVQVIYNGVINIAVNNVVKTISLNKNIAAGTYSLIVNSSTKNVATLPVIIL